MKPYFKQYKGNTFDRDHRGRYDEYYVNRTGRNDLMGAKVARDDENLYFYVETGNNISPSSDRNWMMLMIDIDRNKSTGWEGYDYIINRTQPGAKEVVIEKNIAGRWEWKKVGVGKYVLNDQSLEIEIDREILGVEDNQLDFEFKWNDNMQDIGNIMDFYVNGDTMPGGRFNYVYSEK
ncbi:MAG: hypothetical protein HUJ24_14010 [Rhodobacteraceae bacterium]|nr:hypothetical protein [Paracoccaceae bacterium]